MRCAKLSKTADVPTAGIKLKSARTRVAPCRAIETNSPLYQNLTVKKRPTKTKRQKTQCRRYRRAFAAKKVPMKAATRKTVFAVCVNTTQLCSDRNVACPEERLPSNAPKNQRPPPEIQSQNEIASLTVVCLLTAKNARKRSVLKAGDTFRTTS